ncbi:MAG TPA: M17 family peptidase N-terminal domain-containing protein, partial [Syntrophales bacterium]|nr:M17 family peptidase N-terminal domain-containing protein [Syntrophales bacterium]
MKFTVKAQGPAKVASQAVIVSVFEGMEPLEGGASSVDAALSGTLAERLKGEAFQGKRRQVAILDGRGALPSPRIAVFGLGKKEEFHPGRFREGVAGTVRALRDRGVSEAALSLDPGALPAGPEAIARAAAEGALLGLYRFDLYREKDDQSKKELKSLVFLEESRKGKALAEKGLEAGKTVAEAVLFARDLVNMPANEMTPGLLARRAADMAKGRPLKVTVLDRAALKKMNMNALLAVSKGS